ncbi:cystic fibrosis transmembrane conductance regulator [Rhynchospora pubera]|uniref:Cystic fibrosis transmembrane conductance regulator n=1 Tax=Rhynchospora pubera TaxID=906938 RepID=A0AAV8H6Y1_9POAL|nr:cystic fibrosis transmembrane conductance regulator [Rhynchospora pubera]KAJ4811527.1 cystic fibrosis transmembrane conductance regulator [Rhynchospora pubera]
MVGLFARLSGGRAAHRRTKSAVEVRETVIPNSEAADSVPTTEAPSHGIGLALEFKPVEHPVEPVNHDQPIKCPLPEPSILNDGRIWKERMTSLGARVRTDLRVVREGSQLEPDSGGSRPKPVVPRRAILPSMSAPESHFVELLEECDNPSIENANSSD